MAKLSLIFYLYTQICNKEVVQGAPRPSCRSAHSAVSILNPTFHSPQSWTVSFHTTSLCLASLVLGAWKHSECSREGIVFIRDNYRVEKCSANVQEHLHGICCGKMRTSWKGCLFHWGTKILWGLILLVADYRDISLARPFWQCPFGEAAPGIRSTLACGIYWTTP